MCIRCCHTAALTLVGLLTHQHIESTALPVEPYKDDVTPLPEREAIERHSLHFLGDIMRALAPALGATAHEQTPEQVDAAEREAHRVLATMFNETNIPSVDHAGSDPGRWPSQKSVMVAGHQAVWLADALLYLSGVVEDFGRRSGLGHPDAANTHWADKIKATRESVLRASGLHATAVAVPVVKDRPVGTGPNGELH